ncbi:MAG: TolC family protein [Gammaproteobacteria bacterium]
MRFCVVVAGLVLLGGCATYHSLPLAKRPNLAPAAATAAVPLRLGLRQAGALAVARAPKLAAARAKTRIAAAKAYNAGLLPAPSLALSLAHPFNGGAASDHHNAWSAGLTESLIGLITHSETHSAATAHYAEQLLSWRWQKRQVALQAETAWSNARVGERETSALQSELEAARTLLSAARKAHAAGALATVLYQQANTQVATLRTRLQTARDRKVQADATLADLLRVPAERVWRFAKPTRISIPTAATVATAIARLPQRRLDLLALQAGYRSADAQLRAAILAQFPILDIGFTRSRDNTGVNSIGFGITLHLPFFNDNRGKIAIDRATRQALNAAYQAHLDTAVTQVQAVYERLRIAQRELSGLKAQLPALKQTAKASQAALARGEVTRFQAYAALSAWLDARINADQLQAKATQFALILRVLLALPAATQPATPTGTRT